MISYEDMFRRDGTFCSLRHQVYAVVNGDISSRKAVSNIISEIAPRVEACALKSATMRQLLRELKTRMPCRTCRRKHETYCLKCSWYGIIQLEDEEDNYSPETKGRL